MRAFCYVRSFHSASASTLLRFSSRRAVKLMLLFVKQLLDLCVAFQGTLCDYLEMIFTRIIMY